MHRKRSGIVLLNENNLLYIQSGQLFVKTGLLFNLQFMFGSVLGPPCKYIDQTKQACGSGGRVGRLLIGSLAPRLISWYVSV